MGPVGQSDEVEHAHSRPISKHVLIICKNIWAGLPSDQERGVAPCFPQPPAAASPSFAMIVLRGCKPRYGRFNYIITSLDAYVKYNFEL